MNEPCLTVLICTHDRVDLLRKTLVSLNSSTTASGWQVEILVIANACSDSTHTFLDEYPGTPGSRLPLRWHAETTPGKSHALNLAITLIKSDLVAFVDDDHRVGDTYLKAVCEAADTNPEADLFCGRILPDWDGSEPAWVHDNGPYRIYPLPVPRFDLGGAGRAIDSNIAIPGGGNLFLRTPWLRRVGPFAVELGPVGHNLGGAEDIEWVLRALDMGARLRYAPEVVQHHYVDNERLQLRYLLAKAFERTASSVRMNHGNARGIPLYMYRKLFGYLLSAVTAWTHARRRFFLVRLAASLGEIKGYRQALGDRMKNT